MAVPTGSKRKTGLGTPGAPITTADGLANYAEMVIPVGTDGTAMPAGSASDPSAVGGSVAHDAAAGSTEIPILEGGVATNNFQTAVANGDKVKASYSLYGEKIMTVGSASTISGVAGTTNLLAFRGLTGSLGLLGVQSFVASGNAMYAAPGDGSGAMVQGREANDAPYPNVGLLTTGGYAANVAPTAVGSGDIVRPWHSRVGGYFASGIAFVPADNDGQTIVRLTDEAGTGRDLGVAPSLWDGTQRVRMRGSTTGQNMIGGVPHDAVDTAANVPVKMGGRAAASQPTQVADADVVNAYFTQSGKQVVVTGAAGNGADNISNGAVQYTFGTNDSASGSLLANVDFVFNGSAFDRDVKPNANARLLSSAATTNGSNIKASPGNCHKVRMRNTAATPIYFKLYNKASAPTVGTDAPFMTFYVPALTDWVHDFGDRGHYFSAGIGWAWTAAAADADTTAVAAGDIVAANLQYS